MRLSTYQGEPNFPALVRRLYQLDADEALAKEQTERAGAMLLRANPQLRDLPNVPQGSRLIVPDVDGVPFAQGQAPEVNQDAIEVIRQLSQALGTARDSLNTSFERETEDLKGTLALAKDRSLRELSQQIPEVAEHLASVTRRAKAQLEDMEGRRSARQQDMEQLERDFSECLQTLL